MCRLEIVPPEIALGTEELLIGTRGLAVLEFERCQLDGTEQVGSLREHEIRCAVEEIKGG